jgi:hypothetical protein
MPPIVPLADALAHLGITPGADPAVDNKVSGLLDAISAEVRRITRRGFEGTPTVYDEVLHVADAATVVLPHAPVTEVLAVRRTYFDGTEDALLEARLVIDGFSSTLAAVAAVGAANLKLTSVTDLVVGRKLAVGLGDTLEVVRVATVGTAGSGGTGVDVEPALRFAQANGATAVEVSGSEDWLLELPRRGRLRLRRLMDYGRFTWLVSGDVPADVTAAVKEWLTSDWEAQQEPDLDPATRPVSSESHDSWSQAYESSEESETAAGTAAAAILTRLPPPRVSRVLTGYFHPTGGGPVQ